jgi:AcrR family transcriptional regulator
MTVAREPQPAAPLPRGRHAAPREVVWESQRGRLLAAMAMAVAAKGYGAVAVRDVIAQAGVSRKTFYEHFDNKEECFLAAYDAGVESMLGAIDSAIRAAGSGDAAAVARAGTACYLDTLAANPAFARTFLVEVPAAGPAALRRRGHAHERFADQLAAARGTAGGRPQPPRYVFRACVGAINELVTDHVIQHGAGSLPDLLGPLVEIETTLLAPTP